MTGSLGRTVYRAGVVAILVLMSLWPSTHPVASETTAFSEIQSIGQTERGVGAAFDGSHVWYTLGYASDPNIYRIDPGTGSVVASLNMVALTGGRTIVPGGLAWDSNRQHLWVGTMVDLDAFDQGSLGEGEIFEIDPLQATVVSSFPTSLITEGEEPFPGFIDGLAFDAHTDTVWFSPLEAVHVYQVTVEGALVSSFALPFPLAIWNAGLTFDANHLWLSLRTGGMFRDGLQGFTEVSLAEFTKEGDLLRLHGFPSAVNPRGSEDLAFDAVTFAPQCVVWLTSSAATLTPLEVPCPLLFEATMGPGETLDLEVEVALDRLAAGGIEGPTADAWWEVTCGASDIAVALLPGMHADAAVGASLLFDETIEVAADAVAGDYHCTVTFLVDTGTGEGTPFEQQTIWITVEPPEEIPPELPEQLPFVEVPVDIRPGSCRNPLNVKSQGVLPVAILGTGDFDVSQIDPSTVELEGISPLRWSMEDVATPYEPYMGKEDAFDCTTDGPDGFFDLTLKFSTQAIVGVLGEVFDGDVLVLGLHGEHWDGTSFDGEDVVVILKKGKN
ncbi:MAG: hypothetical protein ACE5JE_02215 [Thermoplasmata archaeon]